MRRPAAALLLLLAAACSGGGSEGAAPTTAAPVTEAPTTAAPVTTTTTTVTIPRGAPRATTTTARVALTPGGATIGGAVNGPAGPVDGATVKIERLVGKEVASTEVRSTGGAYSLGSVLGGAYRVRAWKAPDLAQNGTEVFFLAANEEKRLDLTLVQYGTSGVTATVEPDPPKVDQSAVLTVRLGGGRVDDEGRVTTSPRGSVPVTLAVGPGLVLESPPQLVTDPTGIGAWRVRCTAPGAFPVTLTIAATATALTLPACAAP